MTTATHELHLDNNQVVNMLQIIPYGSFCEPRIAVANDEVASGTYANLAGNVTRQDKLAVVPADFNLIHISDMFYL